jgi:hypothetical protein
MTHMSNSIVDIVRKGIVKGSHGNFTLWPRATILNIIRALETRPKVVLVGSQWI